MSKKTTIYKIVCKDEAIKDVYIGSTYNYNQRKSQHKFNSTHCPHKLYEVIRNNNGWDNWNMVLIEEFQVNDKFDKLKKERDYIELLNANLNSRKPYQTLEEKKLYNQTDKYKEYQKKYHLTDKWKNYIKDYIKKRRDENKNVSNIII